MQFVLLFLVALTPFDDLTPEARKDYQRLERRLEADMRSKPNDTVAASGRLLTAMRLSTRGADSQVDGSPPLYGRYREYGRRDYFVFHQDGRVEFEEWGQIRIVDTGRGWIAGMLPNGNRVEIRSTFDGGAVLLVADPKGTPTRSAYLTREGVRQ